LSNVSSPFVVLEMDSDAVREANSPNSPAQTAPLGLSGVRRRLSRFRSPGKPNGKASNHGKGSLRLLLGGSSGEKENGQLRDLLVSQLDLIQRQSEDIVKKDRRLRELQRENEALRKRLTNIEFKDKDSANSSASNAFVEAASAYFVLTGEAYIKNEKEEVKKILSHAEVPGWRMRVVPPSYSNSCSLSSAEEPVDDDTLLRRHNKPELEEKRRKRWDIQRMREQRQVARLKARYEKHPKRKCGAVRRKEWDEVCNPFTITHVYVGEKVPVVALKAPLPHRVEEDFELPWKQL